MPIYNDDLFKLDDESRKIAKSMGEDPAQKLSQIEVLRTWIMSHKYLECRTDDKFLLKFLRVSKFSCEAAKERITKYCIARSSKLDGMPEWFRDLDARDPKIRELLEAGFIYHMPRLDNLGRVCFIVDLDCMKGLKSDPVDVFRACYLEFEYLFWKYDRCQINGFAAIGNMTYMYMDLLTYLSPEKVKKCINMIQGAFPCRLKQIGFYNLSPILKPIIDLAISLFSAKLQKRISVHSSDYKPPDDVTLECMPKCLDGAAPAFSEIKDEFLRQLEDFQSELDSLKMCKVDDEKMPKHYEDGDSWGITGTYRAIQTE